jgi:hypothetical protein
MTEEHLPELNKALANPMWDDAFWTALGAGEERAKKALLDLYDESYEGYGCSCDTCVIRTVLESVWPELTEQFTRLVAMSAPVQTLGGPASGGGCKGNCACRRKE